MTQGKSKVLLSKSHAMNTYGRVKVELHAMSTSILDIGM
jgi:hypothetical protein